jgi:hypothetical protein
MAYQGIADHADGRDSDQGIGQDVHHRLPGWKSTISTNWSHPSNAPFIDRSNEVWNFGRKSSALRVPRSL